MRSVESAGCASKMIATQGAGSSNEQAEVLSAMLRLAEGEIRGKDEQIELLHQMVAKTDEDCKAKDVRIAELEQQVDALKDEIDQFKGLFNRYLTKAEAARSRSAFTRASANGSTDISTIGKGLPPPSAAALVDPTTASALHLSTSPSPRRQAVPDDDMLPPPPSDDAPYYSPQASTQDGD